MLNRFAQPLYGKIIYIYETSLSKDDLATIFSPSTYWIDVTGLECEVGYIVEFVEDGGLRFVPPPKQERTLEEEKMYKKELLKYERDRRETLPITYKDKSFDYDDKARERLNIARQALEDNNLPSQMWTCADNTDIELTVEDFKNINSLAAQRSGQLHDTYRKLCDYIDKLKTADEVNAVTFDTEVIQ